MPKIQSGIPVSELPSATKVLELSLKIAYKAFLVEDLPTEPATPIIIGLPKKIASFVNTRK